MTYTTPITGSTDLAQFQNSKGQQIGTLTYSHNPSVVTTSSTVQFHTTKRSVNRQLHTISQLLEQNADLFRVARMTTTAASSMVQLEADADKFYQFLVRFYQGVDMSTENAIDNVTNQCIEMEVSEEFKKGALAALEIILNNKHLEDIL